MKKRKRKYSQLDSLTSSRNVEISRLSIIVKSLEERLESIEESHNDLLHKINALDAKGHSAKPKSGRPSRYACDMCGAKLKDSKHLQQHRKNAHKAPYNI
jgi:septation ring formation regulator EzrA